MIKLKNLLTEVQDRKYDTDEFIKPLEKFVRIVPKGVEWNVPYNARTDNKKVNDGRKALSLIQGAVKELDKKGDDSGYFVVSDIRFDRDKFDEVGGAAKVEKMLDQVAKGQHYYRLDKVVDFFRYEEEMLDKIDTILIRLWTDTASATGRKLGRGDLGKLD